MSSCTTDGVPAKATGNTTTKSPQDAPLTFEPILLKALAPRAGELLARGVVLALGGVLLALGRILLVLRGKLTLRLLLIV